MSRQNQMLTVVYIYLHIGSWKANPRADGRLNPVSSKVTCFSRTENPSKNSPLIPEELVSGRRDLELNALLKRMGTSSCCPRMPTP